MGSLFRLLALREIRAHVARSSLTAAGVAIGTAVVVAVLALNASVLGGFQGMVDTLAGGADLQVRGGQGGISVELVERAQKVAGVEAVGAFLEGWLLDPATGERVLLIGVDFLATEPAPGIIDAGALNESAMQEMVGDPFTFLNSTDAVILNADYAHRLPLKKGETRRYVTPTGPRAMKVAGILPESSATRALGGAVALMSVDAAQLLLGKPNRVDVINLRLARTAVAEDVRKAARAALGEGLTVEAPERRGKRLARMMLTLTTVMRLISVVAILVGIFIVQNTLSTAVLQRRREIAVQRALGASKLLCWTLVLLEAAALSLLGALAGVPAGLGMARAAMQLVTESISTLYTEVRPTPPDISPQALALVVMGAVVAACVAAIRPAQHATAVPPAHALGARGSQVGPVGMRSPRMFAVLTAALLAGAWVASGIPEAGAEPWWGYVACIAVLGAGAAAAPVVLVLMHRAISTVANRLGLAMRLGTDGLTRDGSRSARTVIALMLGLSLYIGVNGVVHSMKTTLLSWVDLAVPADLSIYEGTSLPDARAIPMEPRIGDQLAEDPGVAMVVRQRFRSVDLTDGVTKVQAMDMRGYLSRARLPVVEAAGPLDPAALEAGEILVSESLARMLHTRAGQELVMPTPTGNKTLRIRAVVEDYSSEIGAVFMDWSLYARWFEDPMVDSFGLFLKPDASPDAVRDRILARFGQDLGLRVVTHQGFRSYVEQVVDDAFAATRALQLVAVLIALMGIINTLLAAVLDRLREIGVLRAVGATRGQVVRILTAEAVLLGLASALLAAGVGCGFGWVFTQAVASFTTGWRLPFVPPIRAMFESAGLALLVSAVAAALPARQGAAVDILVATRSE